MLRRLGATLTLSALLLLPAGSASAAEAQYGAGWLLDRLNAQGFVPKSDGTPDYGATVTVGLALAAAGVGEEEFDAIVDLLADDVDAFVVEGSADRAGALGRLAMLAYAAGEDPNDFGGEALLDRILATDTAALFGDPSYPGIYSHASALLGLATGGPYTPEQEADIEEALDLLVAQQCPNGGWQNDVRTGDAACGTGFAGPDTNTTSLVVQALAAFEVDPGIDPLTYYAAARNADGGFGYAAGQATDANSTALSVQALRAAGGDPAAALAALLRLQLGCTYDAEDRGAWAFQPEDDGSLEANGFATGDAVPAAAGAVFPLDVAEFGDASTTMPCAAPPAPPSPTAPPLARPTVVAEPAPAPVPTLPATGGSGREPWDTKGLAVFGGGILGYGVLALVGARFAGRRAR